MLIRCLLLLAVLISPYLAATFCKAQSSTCTTDVCNSTASQVLSYMKPSVDPCTDFYQFACGGFLDTAVIPSDKTGIDDFYETEDQVKVDLRTILEEKRTNDPKHFQLTNQLYNACLNTELIESLGNKPITSIADALGGFPVGSLTV